VAKASGPKRRSLANKNRSRRPVRMKGIHGIRRDGTEDEE